MAGKRGAGEGTVWKRDGRWYAKRRIGSREAVVTINASGSTRAEALDELRRKVEQHERGGGAPAVDSSVTLADYLRWWVEVELADRVADGTLLATTRQQYANRIRFQIVPLLGKVRLRDLSAVHVRQWLTALSGQGASPSVRQHAHAVLKNGVQQAVRYELLVANPVKLVDPPKVYRQRRAGISLDAARVLLLAARGDQLEAAYVLALHVPLRVGEVLGVEWDCFDFTERLFEVRQNIVRIDGRWELHDTKKHSGRVIPVPDTVLDALRRQRARQAQQRLAAGSAWQPPEVFDVERRQWRRPDFVFTRPTGKPHLQQGFYKQLRVLCTRAGVPPIATHDLRRAANTLLLASGVDPVVVRQLAGHKSEAMTDLYTTRLDSRMQEAVQRLALELT